MTERDTRPADLSGGELQVFRVPFGEAHAAALTVAENVLRRLPVGPRELQRAEVWDTLAMLGLVGTDDVPGILGYRPE